MTGKGGTGERQLAAARAALAKVGPALRRMADRARRANKRLPGYWNDTSDYWSASWRTLRSVIVRLAVGWAVVISRLPIAGAVAIRRLTIDCAIAIRRTAIGCAVATRRTAIDCAAAIRGTYETISGLVLRSAPGARLEGRDAGSAPVVLRDGADAPPQDAEEIVSRPRGMGIGFAVLLIRGLVIACAVALILPYLLTPLYRVVDPVSTLMMWRWVTHGRVERVVEPIDLMGPALPRAVLAAEDGRFCRHHGIDFAELRVVIEAQARGIRRPRGGSSITQQLAKNLFLWPGHNYVRKVLEFPLALWIDLTIPKRRQLEIYLNVVEWGPNGEFGAEAAARRAFGKRASALSPAEAALLTATLPNPFRRDARRPGDGLRRLAAVYVRRTAGAADIDRCLHTAR